MPEGFLVVSSHPSPTLPLPEYHAWYEEEHIPIRLNCLRSFLSGARYQAIDLERPNAEVQGSVKPSWLAMYEIDSTRTFRDPSYTSLREKRSEREKDVMGRLDVLVRRTGEILGVWGEVEGKRTTGLKVGKPSAIVVTHGLDARGTDGEQPDTNDQSVKAWAERISKSLQTEHNAWVRMRIVKVLDSGKTRMGDAVDLEEGEKGRYFIVHELAEEKREIMDAIRRSLHRETEEALLKTADWRVWKLYKAYPCLAQRNVSE